MIDEMPEQPKTVELGKVPDWAIELTKSVKTGIAELRADVALVSNDLGIVKDRVAILETQRNDETARVARTSSRVREVSQHDLEQSAQLVHERAAREALAAKVDAIAPKVDALTVTQETQLAILSRLDKITSNPLVKTFAAMVATAIMTWLASRGYSIK